MFKYCFVFLAFLGAVRIFLVIISNDPYSISKYFMADDSFYYFQIARNIASGIGSTFDGNNLTNGYHPLWLIITSLIFLLSNNSDIALLTIFSLQWFLVIISAIILFFCLSKIEKISAFITTILFLSGNYTYAILFNGMESTLSFFLISLVFCIALKKRENYYRIDTNKYLLILIMILTCQFLCRLEVWIFVTLWIIMAFISYYLFFKNKNKLLLMRLFMLTFTLITISLIYIFINYKVFGLPFPISAYIKVTDHFTSDIMHTFKKHIYAYCGLLSTPFLNKKISIYPFFITLLLLVSTCLQIKSIKNIKLNYNNILSILSLLPFLLFILIFLCLAVWISSGHWNWYLWPTLFAGFLSTFLLIKKIIVYFYERYYYFIIILLLIFIAFGYYSVFKNKNLADWAPKKGMVMDYTIKYIKEQIPRDERIIAFSCGIFTFFTNREIENFEGLVNSYHYYMSKKSIKNFRIYFKKKNIKWIIFHTYNKNNYELKMNEICKIGAIIKENNIDDFYNLNLKKIHKELSDPNVYFVKIKVCTK